MSPRVAMLMGPCLALLALSGLLQPPLAVAAQAPAADIALLCARSEAVAGEGVVWLVTVMPPVASDGCTAAGRAAPCPLTDVRITPADPTAWQLAPVTAVAPITIERTVAVTAVARLSGDLLPMLRVAYRQEGREVERLVVAAHSIRVTRAADGIVGTLALADPDPASGDLPRPVLSVRNTTPFTLNAVQVVGVAPGITLAAPAGVAAIAPGAVATVPLAIGAMEGTPQLAVRLAAQWNNALDVSENAIVDVAGPVLSPRPGAVERILLMFPTDLLAVVLAVATALLTTLGTQIVRSVRDRRLAWGRLRGMLQVTLLQAQNVKHTAPVDLKPFMDVFTDRELYKVARVRDLADPIRKLWERATLYNEGLSELNARTRTDDLARAAEVLRERLAHARPWSLLVARARTLLRHEGDR